MNTTASRLMDVAEGHIRDAGYGGFSFRDLAAEVGIKSASVHHHFPTKAIMAAAVARRYGERFMDAVAVGRGADDDAISIYMAAFRQALALDGKMCLCGVLGAEAGGLAPEVMEEINSFFRRCVDDLSDRIGGGPEARCRALHVLATLEGGMILARAYGSIEAFDSATKLLLAIVSNQQDLQVTAKNAV